MREEGGVIGEFRLGVYFRGGTMDREGGVFGGKFT